MDHFQSIYATKAKEYHRMIAVEDVDGNLIKTLLQIAEWENMTVLDLGSGTGRFPLLFSQINTHFTCLDLHRNMLQVNKILREEHGKYWGLIQGDMRSLPCSTCSADIVIAGWAIGHLRSWFHADWQNQIGKILTEMQRIAKPGGTLIICETLSTGSLIPRPPAEELAQYYRWLEDHHGFEKQVIQTDYQFTSIEQAVEETEFFFGAELAESIRVNGWARLPEWTGIWFRKV